MGYKRMTRFSKFNAQMRPYYAWRDELRFLAKAKRFELPDQFLVVFYVPMPKSWSKKRRVEMEGRPHQQKPDASNYLKALEDALKEEDCTIWNVAVCKLWAPTGRIEIETYGEGGKV